MQSGYAYTYTFNGDSKGYSFPYRTLEVWNTLEAATVNAKNINEFISKMNSSTCIMEIGQHEHSSSCMSQLDRLGKYTHTNIITSQIGIHFIGVCTINEKTHQKS